MHLTAGEPASCTIAPAILAWSPSSRNVAGVPVARVVTTVSASLAADELPRNVPARLRRLRTALGLTQTELAARLGVSFASVNRWERGHTSPASLAWQSILRLERTEPPSGNLVVSADGDNPPLDFAGNPALVRLVAEGERLASGYDELTESSKAWIYLAMSRLYLTRLAAIPC